MSAGNSAGPRKYCEWFDFLLARCAILERNGLAVCAVRHHLGEKP